MSDNHKAIICPLRNIRNHPNADRLNIATASGYNIITSLDNFDGQIGLYFSCDLQLSEEFAEKNDLIRRKDDNGVQCGGMFESNRRVRAQKLRGAISDGFWIPIDSLDFTGADYSVLKEGELIDEFGGVPICNKYVTPATQKSARGSGNQKPSRDKIITNMFKEHLDTSHWVRCEHTISDDTNLIVNLKCHGTSARCCNARVYKNLKWYESLLKRFGFSIEDSFYKFLVGSRRVIKTRHENTRKINSRVIHHEDDLWEKACEPFRNSLHKNESLFMEIVGYETSGKPIMSSVNTKSLKDKAFTKQFGENMTYSYGCQPGQFDIYVYRITTTNEDGISIDYSWDTVKMRCLELGVKYVPELWRGKKSELTPELLEELSNGPDVIDPRHWREGVCIREESNLFHPRIFKNKNFTFKCLEGIVKDTGVEDIEESN